jgi:hypothetical protein
MALPAQTQTRVIEEIAYTLEAIWPGIQRVAFNHSIISQIFFGEMTDEQYGERVLTGRGKVTQDGGQKILHRLELGTSPNTARLAGPWATYTTTAADLVRQTEANWKHYTDAATVNDTEVLINKGKDALADIATERANNAMKSLVDFAVRDLLTGTLGTAFTGLETLIGANDTVQNLAGSTAAYNKWNSWGLSGKDTAAASVSFASGSFAVRGIADMRDAHTNCSYGNVEPDVICTTEDVRQFYEGSLVPQERYTAPASKGDAGIPNLAFYMKPVYRDVFLSSGTMLFLNLDKIKFVVLGGADFAMQQPQRALNQEATSTQIQLKGQTLVLDRRLQNKLTGITA